MSEMQIWERISQYLKIRDEEVVANGDASDEERMVSAAMILQSLKISPVEDSMARAWNELLEEFVAEAKEHQEIHEAMLEMEDYMGGRK